MSENMVERVARAIEETNANTTGVTFSQLLRHMARAALEAMREPTEAMEEAGFEVSFPRAPTAIYRAMIDSAIRSGEKG